MLWETLTAYQRRDPAARGKLEILLLYAGVHATLYHRAAHWLYRRGLRFLARCVSQWSRFWTGIEIHPGAVIGRKKLLLRLIAVRLKVKSKPIVILLTFAVAKNVKLIPTDRRAYRPDRIIESKPIE